MPSSGVRDHQRGGRNRRCLTPSAVSRTCSAPSETTVIAMPTIIASSLEQRRRGAVAGVDGGRELQAGRRGTGQVGEDADDLRPEVVAAALAAERVAGFGLAVGVRPFDESDEFAGDPVGVRGERQLLAGGAEHLGQRRADHRGVAHDDQQVGADALDEQAAVDGLGRLFGDGGQQDGPVGVLGAHQAGGGAAGDGHLQVGRHVADQRRVDALHDAVLRPVELGGGLGDRQERRRDRQQGSEQACDDGDESRRLVVGPGTCHGARC